MRAFLTRTHSTPEIYILIGTALFAALPFSVIFDIIIDVEWAAPNPECDSFGPVLSGFGPVVLVSTVVGFVASGVLVMLCALNKVSGLPVFTLTQKPIWKNALISTVFAPLIGLCLLGVGFYTWLALMPHHIVADCNGTADEAITLDRRGPIFQTVPLLCLGLGLWLLHLRALALSPHRNPSTKA